VQAEIERRKNLGRPSGCISPFTAKIVCGDCGGFYGSKVWGSNTKYRRTIWRCNEKYKGNGKCKTPHITEDDLKQRFLSAFNTLMGDREEIIDNCRLAQSVLCAYSEIDMELKERRREIEVVTELSRKAIFENAQVAVSQEEWGERNDIYLERHRNATERVAELDLMKREKQSKKLMLESFIQDIKSRENTLDEFDEWLWMVTISKVTILRDGKLVFRFKDGTEV